MIYAVIPTGNRPNEYRTVINWCNLNQVKSITIATSEQAAKYSDGITIKDNSLNISKWWDLGLEYAYKQKDVEIVLILNDDVVLPHNWLHKIKEAIDSGASGASGQRQYDRSNTKIAGYAFALNPIDNILPDKNLVWYFTDDAVQNACNKKNGFKVISGLSVANLYARSSESIFAEQIEKDRGYYWENYS